MKYSLSTKDIELTERDTQLFEEKLARLVKYLTPPFHPRVMLQQDRHHRSGLAVHCAITIRQLGVIIHAERSARTAQGALDEVLAALKGELIKRRDKRRRRR